MARHVHINYGPQMEEVIRQVSDQLRASDDVPRQFPIRYWAAKLIEGDKEAGRILSGCKDFDKWHQTARQSAERIERELKNDVESIISDYKYGFIAGALEETLSEGGVDINLRSRRIDRLVANKWLGFPIFILLVWIMFYATYALGSYPQGWIESGFGLLGE